MAINDSTIQEIKNRIDIVDVINDFVSLKKVGTNYRALSPFTQEKTPSFYVSPSKDIFKCFSTGKGGDAISFIMEIEGINYVEALKYLAAKYGIEIQEEEQTDEQINAQNERDSLFIALKYAGEFFQDTLWNHSEGKSIGLSYFKERGFSEAAIKKFELGYSLDQWDGLMKSAISKGYSEDILEKAGLILKSEGKAYDRFRGRVMFPIHNVGGKVIAFGARTLLKDKKQPKYINSPETGVYHKSDIVYGIHQARQAIRNEDLCYLVEGYTDVISMHQSGVENVVASSGTSLTKEQIQLISRYTKNITVLYDGDSAGIKASFRGIDLILESDLNVHAVVFPEGEDPDSFSRTMSSEAFKDYLISNSQDFITFKIKILSSDTKGISQADKSKVVSEIINSLVLISDAVKRSHFIKVTSEMMDVDESSILHEVNRILKKKAIDYNKKQRADRDIENQIQEILPEDEQEREVSFVLNSEDREKECIRLLLNYPANSFEMSDDGETKLVSVAEYLFIELSDIEFESLAAERIFKESNSLFIRNESISPDYFLDFEDIEIKKLVIDCLEVKYFLSDGWQGHAIRTTHESEILYKEVHKTILRLKKRKLEMLIRKNHLEMKTAHSQNEQDELLKVYIYLKSRHDLVSTELGTVVNL